MSNHTAAFQVAKDLYGKAVVGLKELRWEDVPRPVRRYIEEHPTATSIQILSLLVVACPGLVVTPALGWVGFSATGPVAGRFDGHPFALRKG